MARSIRRVQKQIAKYGSKYKVRGVFKYENFHHGCYKERSPSPCWKAGHTVYGLIRSPEKVAAVKEIGVEPVIGSLDDSAVLTQYAQWSDAVINTASSDHPLAIETFISSLRGSGKRFIHTSGSGVVADDAHGEYEGQQIYEEETLFVPIDP